MLHKLTVPISEEAVTALRVGDQVHLSGLIVTARPRLPMRPICTPASRSSWPEV